MTLESLAVPLLAVTAGRTNWNQMAVNSTWDMLLVPATHADCSHASSPI